MDILPQSQLLIGQYVNVKTQGIYEVYDESINATNANDGQLMIHYRSLDGLHKYVREHQEFRQKFVLAQ